MLHFSERIKICLLYEEWRNNSSENYTIDDSPISFITFLMRSHLINEEAMHSYLANYKNIAPLSENCKKDTIEKLKYLRERLIDERGSDFSGVRALDIAVYCVNNFGGV